MGISDMKNAVKRDIGFASLGNGYSVYDRLHERHGDFDNIAHIKVDRTVEIYVPVTAEQRLEIVSFAGRDVGTVSTTQLERVLHAAEPCKPESVAVTFKLR